MPNIKLFFSPGSHPDMREKAKVKKTIFGGYLDFPKAFMPIAESFCLP